MSELKCCKRCGAFITCTTKDECCPECEWFDPIDNLCMAVPDKKSTRPEKPEGNEPQEGETEVDPDTFLFEDDDEDEDLTGLPPERDSSDDEDEDDDFDADEDEDDDFDFDDDEDEW
ncbi:MAG: hypothetical protein ACFFDQ_10965 [Candidatus Thorarchaeota archaeon]